MTDGFEGHTPGPWDAFPDDYGTANGSTHYSVVTDGASLVLAYVLAYANRKEIPANKANARLIAAAPTLLEENRRLREIYTDVLELLDNSPVADDDLPYIADSSHMEFNRLVLTVNEHRAALTTDKREG